VFPQSDTGALLPPNSLTPTTAPPLLARGTVYRQECSGVNGAHVYE